MLQRRASAAFPIFCRLSRTSCFGRQFQAFPYLSTEVEKGASEESRSELEAAQGAQWQFIRAVNGMGIYQGIRVGTRTANRVNLPNARSNARVQLFLMFVYRSTFKLPVVVGEPALTRTLRALC
jgi:hypothetical protein